MVQWLRRGGVGGRALKSVIAVALSWELGRRIPGATEYPYFAPLAALLSMQLTIAESVTAAINRTLGVIAGVAVALAVGQFLGISVWSVSLVVLVSLVAGPRLRLKSQGTSQVAVSAMLVLFVGSGTAVGYSLLRTVETIIGAVVGVAVNAVLVPPNRVAEARSAVQELIARIAETLRALSSGLSEGMSVGAAYDLLERARSLRDPVTAAREAVQYADASLEFNPRGRRIREDLTELERTMAVLERTAAQTRSMARAVADALGGAPAASHAPLLPGGLTQSTARLLEALADVVGDMDEREGRVGSRGEEALEAARRARDAMLEEAQGAVPELPATAWYTLGALLSLADRMLTDLTETLESRQVRPDG